MNHAALKYAATQRETAGRERILDRRAAAAAEPVFRVAVVGLAAMHDRMPVVPRTAASFSLDRLRDGMALVEEVVPEQQPCPDGCCVRTKSDPGE